MAMPSSSSSPPSSTTTSSLSLLMSRSNLALFCLTAFGLGMLSAVPIFYMNWKSKCHDLLRMQLGGGHTDDASQQHYSATALSSRELQRQLHESEQQLFHLQGSIQRYHQAQVWRYYGKTEPYTIVFTLELLEHDDDEPSEEGEVESYYSYHDVVIELQNLEDMPHTIATFLALADLGLYVGTTLGATSSVFTHSNSNEPTTIMIGGDLHQLRSGFTRQQLVRRYHEEGYGGTQNAPLWFHESSNQLKCDLYSVYMIHSGPSFGIVLSSPPPSSQRQTQSSSPISCPGRVVAGLDLLSRLQHEPATIVETRVVNRAPEQEVLIRGEERSPHYDDEERDEL